MILASAEVLLVLSVAVTIVSLGMGADVSVTILSLGMGADVGVLVVGLLISLEVNVWEAGSVVLKLVIVVVSDACTVESSEEALEVEVFESLLATKAEVKLI